MTQVSSAVRFVPALLVIVAVTLLISVVLLLTAVDQSDRHRQSQSASADYALTLTRLAALFDDNQGAMHLSANDQLAILIAQADTQVSNTAARGGLRWLGSVSDSIQTESVKLAGDWTQIRTLLIGVNPLSVEGNGISPVKRTALLRDLADSVDSFDAFFAAVTEDSLSVQLLRSLSDIRASLKNLEFLMAAHELAAPNGSINVSLAQLETEIAKMQSLTRTGGGALLLGYRTNLLLAAFTETINKLNQGNIGGDGPAASFVKSVEPHRQATEAALERVLNYRRVLESSVSGNRLSFLAALVFVCAALVLCVLCGWCVKRDRLARGDERVDSLEGFVSQINSVADGNLDVNIIGAKDGSSQSIANAMNYTRTIMRSLVMVARGVAEKTRANVDYQEQAIDQLAQAEESRQKHLVLLTRQLAASMDTIEQVGDNESKTRQMFAEVKDSIGASLASVNSKASAQAELSAQVDLGTNRLKRVSSITGELSVLASSIERVAEHTNLLALNTSIQMSAFTDDPGLDDNAQFVDEVSQSARQLAVQAGDASRLISGVGGDVDAVVEILGNSVALLSRCAQHSSIASQSLSELIKTVNLMNAEATESFSDLETDRKKMSEVVAAIRHIDDLSMDSSVSTNKLMRVTSELRIMAMKLDESVSQFRLDGSAQ